MPACRGTTTKLALLGLLLAGAAPTLAQPLGTPQGGEYSPVGALLGDQVQPQAAISSSGGYIVWQDNVSDGDGLGLSARRLNANLSGFFGVFRVNAEGAGDQENPRVALLPGGGAVFVWQGGPAGFQHIFARFMTAEGTFVGGDVPVNTYAQHYQVDPAVTVLANGEVVIAWSSFGQDGSMYGVYGQRFSAAGGKLGPEFQIHQTTSLSQRSPALTALADGGFAVAWVSERATAAPLGSEGLVVTGTALRYTADVMVRLFDSDGSPRAGEVRVNTANDPAANPAIAASAVGRLAVVWSQRDGKIAEKVWDIAGRILDADARPVGAVVQLNHHTFGEQFAPKIAPVGNDFLVAWTSVDQDDSREGVFGRFWSETHPVSGGEFQINTTSVSQQLHPAVASDGSGRWLVVWSGFVGGYFSFEVFAQRYAVEPALVKPPAPFVSPLSQSRLSVTWPELAGYELGAYELFVDEASEPLVLTETMYVLGKLAPGSTHSFRLRYRLVDGRLSAVSDPATGTTWDEDANVDQLPDDWQALYWGANPAHWPAAHLDADGDGASNLMEFYHGTNPTDPGSVLRMQISSTDQGHRLSWNAQPGFVYQVQFIENLGAGAWASYGPPRFATGSNDSVPVHGGGGAAYFRVVRLR